MEIKEYDVVIVGGGVAGMTAAIYAKRRGKNVVVIEKFLLGGQVNTISRIENFPSQSVIDGLTLCEMFTKQIKHLDIQVVRDDVVSLDFKKQCVYGKKSEYSYKSLILASGLSQVELGVQEDKFLGRGVSFCAVCDGHFYKGGKVCVASKNGSGIFAANELSQICEKVVVLDSGNLSVFANANKNKKIEVLSCANIKELKGDMKLQSVLVEIDGKIREISTDALFVELGKMPETKLFDGLKLDAKGFVLTDENMRTLLSNVFAVGDVRSKTLKQIVTACADGAIAGQLA